MSTPKIRRLGKAIITAQSAEIRTMKRIANDLGVTPAEMPMNGEISDQPMRDLETLGLTEEQSGTPLPAISWATRRRRSAP